MKLRHLGLGGLALLSLLPAMFGGACATGVSVGTGGASGAGGSAATTTSTTSSGTVDAGSDAPSGTCSQDTDCSAMNDPCNVGACVNGFCVKGPANEHGSCDDGLFCTENDSCVNGVCVGGSARSCAPPDACHLGTCDEATDTCTSVAGNDGAQCDDMDACTLAGTCSGGTCAKGPPVDCSVLNGTCSVGTCIAGQGCVAMPVNDGTPCNDGLFCTINDKCKSGACTGDPNICAPPNNPCQIGVCNEALQSCSTSSAPNGTACSDGNICKTGQTCTNGMCTGGQAANNGVACDDNNGCTTGTTCVNGTCGNAQSQVNQCINGDNCCPAACAFGADSDCIRPNLLLCGPSSRSPLTFVPAGLSFNLVMSCSPDSSTQAMLVTRSFNNAINAATLSTYLDGGGIVLTEFSISDDVYTLAFGATQQGVNFAGSCEDVAPTVTQFTPGDPFWAANPFMSISPGQTGCGYPVTGYPGLVPLAGWSPSDVSIGYRDHNAGRVWVTEFDWQDQDTPPASPAYAYTNQLMGYMITHRK